MAALWCWCWCGPAPYPALVLVLAWRVLQVVSTKKTGDSILHTYAPGDFFGELALSTLRPPPLRATRLACVAPRACALISVCVRARAYCQSRMSRATPACALRER